MSLSRTAVWCSTLLFLLSAGGSVMSAAITPKYVFINSNCKDTGVGAQVVEAFSQAVRRSDDYRLASRLDDAGSYKAVITVYIRCTEDVDSVGERTVSIASIFGYAACPSGNCKVVDDDSTLKAMLARNGEGGRYGRVLFDVLDEYENGDGKYRFEVGQHYLDTP